MGAFHLAVVVKDEGVWGFKSYAILDRKFLYRGAVTVTCSRHVITKWVDCRSGWNFFEGGSDIPSSLMGQALNGHIL